MKFKRSSFKIGDNVKLTKFAAEVVSIQFQLANLNFDGTDKDINNESVTKLSMNYLNLVAIIIKISKIKPFYMDIKFKDGFIDSALLDKDLILITNSWQSESF